MVDEPDEISADISAVPPDVPAEIGTSAISAENSPNIPDGASLPPLLIARTPQLTHWHRTHVGFGRPKGDGRRH